MKYKKVPCVLLGTINQWEFALPIMNEEFNRPNIDIIYEKMAFDARVWRVLNCEGHSVIISPRYICQAIIAETSIEDVD